MNIALFVVLVIGLVSSVGLIQSVNAQLLNSTIAKIIEDKFTKSRERGNNYDPKTNTIYEVPASLFRPVHVNYESPSTILISGGLINSVNGSNLFNHQLREAMDLIKNQYGFKLQDVMTSGQGSVINPTQVYILMTK